MTIRSRFDVKFESVFIELNEKSLNGKKSQLKTYVTRFICLNKRHVTIAYGHKTFSLTLESSSLQTFEKNSLNSTLVDFYLNEC